MRKWIRWIVGGKGRPSLWRASWNWKLYTFKNEISWWDYVKPPHKRQLSEEQVLEMGLSARETFKLAEKIEDQLK